MIVKKGTTDVTTYFKLIDPATGAPKTGLTITDLDATYVRDRAAAVKADLTALAAVDSAHGDNKAIQIDATNCPGLYRVDWPDAAFATGVNRVQLCVNGAAIDPAYVEVELVNYDPADGVRLGLTALPNAAADAAGGLPISNAGALDLDAILADTNELQTDLHDGGRLDLLVDGIKTKTDYLPSVAAGAAGGLFIAGTNAPVTITGAGDALTLTSTSNGSGLKATGNTGGHGMYLIGGNGIAASGLYSVTPGTGAGFYGTLNAGMITSTTFKAGAITAAAIADGAIDNATFAADVGSTAYATNIIALAAYKALGNYDAPTKTEMDTAFTEIKGATWSAETDTLEAIRNKETDIETDTAEIGAAGAGLTSIPNSAGVTALLAMTEEVA